MPTSASRISFIIVNYRSRHLLAECLASISRGCAVPHEVIIVNNDKNPLPQSVHGDDIVRVIESENNRGFGAGSNRGAASAQGTFLCFLNPDAHIVGENFSSLLSYFDEDGSVGIVGPRLVRQDGTVQPWSTGEDVTLWSTLWNKRAMWRSHMPWHSAENHPVAWVSGAAMVVRRTVFEALGGFDERFFLYFEDVDLCRRARAIGQKVLHIPLVHVIHRGGGSMENQSIQKQHYDTAQELYFEKHFGPMAKNFLRGIRFFYRLFASF